eukprot:1187511-Rhodomonas_salina.1
MNPVNFIRYSGVQQGNNLYGKVTWEVFYMFLFALDNEHLMSHIKSTLENEMQWSWGIILEDSME